MEQNKDADSHLELAELERRWMSHELHDGLLQWVVGAKMQSEALHAKSLDGHHPSADQLRYLVDLLSRAMVEGRRLLSGLRPPELDETDWHSALYQWGIIARAGSSCELNLSLAEETREIADSHQRCAYRIIQESVGNALRHANASKICVEAKLIDHKLRIIVVDDGQGFDIESVTPDRYGLKGMHERAALLGGQVSVESKKGSGTQVVVQLPIDSRG